MTIWTQSIGVDANDGFIDTSSVFQSQTGEGYAYGEYFEVGRSDPSDHKYGVLRFTNVTVPSGATINSADLRFYITSSSGSTDSVNSVITVYADVSANRQAAFSDSSHPPSSNWTNSTASTQENGLTTTGYHTVDVSSIIEELIALGGWASGDDIRFSLDPQANGSDTYWGVNVSDYDADTSAELADLTIDYTEAASGGIGSRINSGLIGGTLINRGHIN